MSMSNGKKKLLVARRRAQILRLRATGLTQQRIAAIVGISQRNVSAHLIASAYVPPPPPNPIAEQVLHQETIGSLAIVVTSRSVYLDVMVSQ